MDTKETAEEIKINDKRGQSRAEEKKSEMPKAAPQQAQAPQAEKAAPKSAYKGSIDFMQFIMSLSSSAAMYLGLIEDPSTGLIKKNLNHAKQQIDVLEMLYFKTQGNLTPEEKSTYDQILYELKLRYVDAAKSPI